LTEFNDQDRERIDRIEGKVDTLLLASGKSPTYAQMWAAIVSAAGLAFAATRLFG